MFVLPHEISVKSASLDRYVVKMERVVHPRSNPSGVYEQVDQFRFA